MRRLLPIIGLIAICLITTFALQSNNNSITYHGRYLLDTNQSALLFRATEVYPDGEKQYIWGELKELKGELHCRNGKVIDGNITVDLNRSEFISFHGDGSQGKTTAHFSSLLTSIQTSKDINTTEVRFNNIKQNAGKLVTTLNFLGRDTTITIPIHIQEYDGYIHGKSEFKLDLSPFHVEFIGKENVLSGNFISPKIKIQLIILAQKVMRK